MNWEPGTKVRYIKDLWTFGKSTQPPLGTMGRVLTYYPGRNEYKLRIGKQNLFFKAEELELAE